MTMSYDYRYYSASDDISSSSAGAMSLVLLPVGFILGAASFLIARVDALNSVLLGLVPIYLTRDMGLDKKTCWIIFGITALVSLLLQHTFLVAKLIGAGMSCFAAAFICRIIVRDYAPQYDIHVVMAIGAAITAIWNIIFWKYFSE